MKAMKRLKAVNPPISGIPRELPPKTIRQVRTLDTKTTWGATAGLDLPKRWKGKLQQPINDGGPGGVVLDLAAEDLWNDHGFLCLVLPGVSAWYPSSSVGLSPGLLWNNNGVVCIAGWSTLTTVAAPPVFFMEIDALQLQALGGAGLPLSPSFVNQLWNNRGVVCVGGIY